MKKQNETYLLDNGSEKVIRLDSGLTISVIEDAGARFVDARVGILVGSNDDPVGKEGAAHFLEHLLFLGAKKFKTHTSIFRRLMAVGCNYDASTGRGSTEFEIKMRPSHAKEGIEVVFDLFFGANLYAHVRSKKAFNAEKQVVEAELRGQLNQDGGLSMVVEKTRLALLNGQDSAQPIIGFADTVRKMQPEDILNFRNSLYSFDKSRIEIVTPPDVFGKGNKDLVKFISRLADRYPKMKKSKPIKKIKFRKIDKYAESAFLDNINYIDGSHNKHGFMIDRFDSESMFDIEWDFSTKDKLKDRKSLVRELLYDTLFHDELSTINGEGRKRGLFYHSVGYVGSDLNGDANGGLSSFYFSVRHDKIIKFLTFLRKSLSSRFDKRMRKDVFEMFKESMRLKVDISTAAPLTIANDNYLRTYYSANKYIPIRDRVAVIDSITEIETLEVLAEDLIKLRHVFALVGPTRGDSGKNIELERKITALIESIIKDAKAAAIKFKELQKTGGKSA